MINTTIKTTLKWMASLLVLCMTVGAKSDAADDLERQFTNVAPAVLEQLRADGFQNVGVLKFRVKKGDSKPSDRVGTLNLHLAEKLELALILANEEANPVGIIRDANAVASTIQGASHLNPTGRQKLFSEKYPVSWGSKKVVPDAFVTGVALIRSDFSVMTVGLGVIDSKGNKMKSLAQFDVKPDLDELLQSGESFTVRGVFDKASLKLSETERKEKASKEAVLTSTLIRQETKSNENDAPAVTENEPASKTSTSKLHPLSPKNSDSPVSLEIRYDNQVQDIEFQGGVALVHEPKEGQKVVFVVRRKKPGSERYGVVLKVNGENTVRRERKPDPKCTPWVMEANADIFGVYGYMIDNQTTEEFRVLSDADSSKREIDYGIDTGLISITVFGEQKVPPTPDPIVTSDDGEDFALLINAERPKETPSTLASLQRSLRGQGPLGLKTRGLIVEGKKTNLDVGKTKFKVDSVPLMSATVRYYNAKDLPPGI